jgi:hypothetical protein
MNSSAQRSHRGRNRDVDPDRGRTPDAAQPLAARRPARSAEQPRQFLRRRPEARGSEGVRSRKTRTAVAAHVVIRALGGHRGGVDGVGPARSQDGDQDAP